MPVLVFSFILPTPHATFWGIALAGQQQHLILTRVCVGSPIVPKVTF
jgi:hypothetical protein